MVIKKISILPVLFLSIIPIQVHTVIAKTLTKNTEVKSVLAIIVSPKVILQGDPVMISLGGSSIDAAGYKFNVADIKSGTIGKTKLSFFTYKNIPTALYGIDINQKSGTSTVIIKLKDGKTVKTDFFVGNRPKATEFLAVPNQLGGNSNSNQTKIVSILNKENISLNSIVSKVNKMLWNTLVFPVASTTQSPMVVTDTYGYTRDSGSQTITHKGTDFKAASGTPILSIGEGKVLVTKKFITYGDTIVIDHGLGLLSMYMHLSKISVRVGETVKSGQIIGNSGESGYSEGPHLHLTIRVGGISIDPMKFYELFGLKM